MAETTVQVKLSKADLAIMLAALIHHEPGLFSREGKDAKQSLGAKLNDAVREITEGAFD